jgi:hypothetical protein
MPRIPSILSLGRGRGLGGLAISLCTDLAWNSVKVGMEGEE